MKKVIVQTFTSLLSIAAVSYGRLHSIPDAVNRTYGFPFNWGIHQLSTIAGSVNIWHVNVTYLAVDLVFWLVIILVSSLIFGFQRKSYPEKTEA